MYNILAIRTAMDEDGTMYPVLGGESFPIELEPLDGANASCVVATSVTVHQVTKAGLSLIAKVADIRANLIITDARVAIACTKYDKGGGWVGFGGGGAFLSLGLNAASIARAAHRRKGKMLVGHIRYPWLARVGSEPRTGFGSRESIRFIIYDGENRQLALTVGLAKDVDASAGAQEIARRAARYRLTHTELTDAERGACVALSAADRLPTTPKKFTFHNLPTHVVATQPTALPASPTSAVRA